MTDRDKRFVDEYMIDFDAKNAAIRAGYPPGTAKNAYAWIKNEGGAVPTKPQLRAEIDRRMARLSRRCGVTAERTLMELARVAFSDITDAVDVTTGGVRAGASREDTAAIRSVRVKRGDGWVEREVQMCDKARALELIGKRLGLFTEQINMYGGVPVIVDDVCGDG